MVERRQVQNGEPTNDLVFSSYIDTNADVFPRILQLYVPNGQTVADVTFGMGVFWRNAPSDRYNLLASDITDGIDCRDLPYEDASIDCVVLDPSLHAHTGRNSAYKPASL